MKLSFLLVNDRFLDGGTWDVSLIDDKTHGFEEHYLGRMSKANANATVGEIIMNADRIAKVDYDQLGLLMQNYVLGYVKPSEWTDAEVRRGYRFWVMFHEEALA